MNDLPVESFWADGFEVTALLCPCTPTCVFEPDTVGDLVLLLCHGLPTAPYILVGPLMTEVVDADGRHPRLDLCIVGSGRVVRNGRIWLRRGQHLENLYVDLSGAMQNYTKEKLVVDAALRQIGRDCPKVW